MLDFLVYNDYQTGRTKLINIDDGLSIELEAPTDTVGKAIINLLDFQREFDIQSNITVRDIGLEIEIIQELDELAK